MSVLSEYITRITEHLPSKVALTYKKLAAGFSNSTYLIADQLGPRWVLRLPGIEEAMFAINRGAELAIVKQAAQQGISPALRWHDEHGALLSHYVTAPALGWQVKHNQASIKRLARLLAKTHTMVVGEHQYCVFKVIDHYLLQIATVIQGEAQLTAEWCYLEALRQDLPRLTSPLAKTLCHNDVNPQNLLMDADTAWLIDWEYAGVGDPAFDLAVIIQSHNLPMALAKQLCHDYDAQINFSELRACLYNYRKAYVVRELSWLLLYYLQVDPSPAGLNNYYQFKNNPQVMQLLNGQNDEP